ncbi:MAG: 4-hydroxy-3-methylbut-2-enyl diphosphate reductase [Paramuribaculum sp.]|nr:4-hydroxy-3-methylbut-2-enyl diphosphate reductase [Paramuribaculum sp.]
MIVDIDTGSGFCFGVVNAIRKAEEVLEKEGTLYCLGDIVHNSEELDRLAKKGLIVVGHDELNRLHDVKLLLRAHGEPPSTYRIAQENRIEIIDATCPVVLKLQKRIKDAFEKNGEDNQVVIYGKRGHAEVNGLVGQTEGRAIVIETSDDLDKINFNNPISLYSQTTKSPEGFQRIVADINDRYRSKQGFEYYDTICRQVAGRVKGLKKFAGSYDVILFVSGAKSSNGKVLFEECRKVNPMSFLVSDVNGIDHRWFENKESVGICGATSTPRWLMEKIAVHVRHITSKSHD